MSFDCKWFSFGGLQIASWYCVYQGVNVRQELALMAAWCDANPKRAERKKDWKRFANNWLKSEYRKAREARKHVMVGAGPEAPVGSGVKPGVRERYLERGKA